MWVFPGHLSVGVVRGQALHVALGTANLSGRSCSLAYFLAQK